MIDEEATMFVCGYTVEQATRHDKIVAVCDKCGDYRLINKNQYHHLCWQCAMEALTGRIVTEESRRRMSATRQGIPYDEWESYATNSLYCPKFNERCKESNREKYGRHCFLTGAPESANVNKSGKMSKLSVHHVDMDKMQGCNGNRWKLVPLLMGIHTKMHSEVWGARIEYLLEHVWYPDGVWTPDALC